LGSMKKSRFTESKIIKILKEMEAGRSVSEICREYGIHQATFFYNWKSIKYNYIYLNPCDNGLELFEGVREYIEYYNQKKHQTIKKKPNDTYQESICQRQLKIESCLT
jgi:hypothetical protein